jgi:hypothetical protein
LLALKNIMAPFLGNYGFASCDATVASGPGVQGISEDLVFLRLNRPLETLPKVFETIFVQPTFEDAFLNANSVVEADFRDPIETAWASNVVGDEAKHFVSPRWPRMRPGGQEIVPPVCWAVGVQLSRNGA